MDGVGLSSLGLFVSAEFSFVKIRATQVDRLVQGMALARQGKLPLGLLVQSGLSVAVRNDVWKVWRRRRTTKLRKLPARRAGV